MDPIDWACTQLWRRLSEEKFFFFYHFHGMNLADFWLQTPIERSWMIDRLISQRKKENEEIEKRSKAK